MLANGATDALDSVCQTFLEPGDRMFVEAPTFMGALGLFRNYGVELTGFPLDDDGVDLDAVADELAARRESERDLPTVFYTIPNFQNPTGTTLSRDRRERLLELAAEYGFVVIEDDAYGDLRYYGEDVPPLKALDDEGRVVRVGTFSKTIAPGIRTGWVIAHEEILERVRGVSAGGTNTFTRGVVGRFCGDGRLEENVAELREAYRERRDHMLRCLDEEMPAAVEWTEPDGGFFVWVELPEGLDAGELLSDAADEGVVYLPGSMFFPDDRGENCLRLSFSHVSFEEMERGVAALATATRSLLTEA
jgi:2-aminoadipate transaminase